MTIVQKSYHQKAYLGDGVYAKFDGMHVVLTTEDGERATNTIYLEPEVIDELKEYLIRLKKKELL